MDEEDEDNNGVDSNVSGTTPKNLSQLRDELAARCGFGAQPGAGNTLKAILDPILQRSQNYIIREFGRALPGNKFPEQEFFNDEHLPSVSETYLMTRALVEAKAHYRQPDAELAAQNWSNIERKIRAGSG